MNFTQIKILKTCKEYLDNLKYLYKTNYDTKSDAINQILGDLHKFKKVRKDLKNTYKKYSSQEDIKFDIMNIEHGMRPLIESTFNQCSIVNTNKDRHLMFLSGDSTLRSYISICNQPSHGNYVEDATYPRIKKLIKNNRNNLDMHLNVYLQTLKAYTDFILNTYNIHTLPKLDIYKYISNLNVSVPVMDFENLAHYDKCMNNFKTKDRRFIHNPIKTQKNPYSILDSAHNFSDDINTNYDDTFILDPLNLVEEDTSFEMENFNISEHVKAFIKKPVSNVINIDLYNESVKEIDITSDDSDYIKINTSRSLFRK